VGLYPARHVCNRDTAPEPPRPLAISANRAMPPARSQSSAPGPSRLPTAAGDVAAETVERAKVAVGRGWEIVRSINWRDGTKKEPESNGARMWGRLLDATSSARQKVADKYHEVREGGHGLLPPPPTRAVRSC
jgi:hypothetical protein